MMMQQSESQHEGYVLRQEIFEIFTISENICGAQEVLRAMEPAPDIYTMEGLWVEVGIWTRCGCRVRRISN